MEMTHEIPAEKLEKQDRNNEQRFEKGVTPSYDDGWLVVALETSWIKSPVVASCDLFHK
jgi:hypothetical protein